MPIGSPHAYRKTAFIAAALIGLITFVVYLPSLKGVFVNWDDWIYLSSNEHIRHLDGQFIRWVFTNPYASNYHPLTIISYAVDYSLWGFDPFGYHLENVMFHALNTVLVFVLTLRLMRCRPLGGAQAQGNRTVLLAASVTAFLFGLHPIHVESVAWVSERKDVLFMFFALFSVLFYLEYARALPLGSGRNGVYYLASLVSFLLSLMSKPMAITMPAVLLIIDFWPLRRFEVRGGAKKAVLEKMPFFILSAVSAALTIWAQKEAIITDVIPLSTRLLIAVKAYSFYLYKMLLPLDLAPYYPNMGAASTQFSSIEYTASIIVFFTLSVLCVFTIKRRGFFTAAWLYYVVTLLPVVGIIQVGGQAAADRYTYSPSLGPFMLAGAALGYLYHKFADRRFPALIFTAVVAVLAGSLCVITVAQIAVWKDSETLWSREIEVYPIVFAYKNRANHYFQTGRFDRAIEDYTIALRPGTPDAAEVYIKRGISYQRTGDYRRAADDFTAVIKSDQSNVNAYNNRGNAYKGMKDYQAAIADFERALELAPDNAAIYYNIAATYAEAGRDGDALENMKKAAELGLPEAAQYLRSRGF